MANAPRRDASRRRQSDAARRGVARFADAADSTMAISQTRRKSRFFMAPGLDPGARGSTLRTNDGV